MPHGDDGSSQLPRGHVGAKETRVRVVGGTVGWGVAENNDREDEGACQLQPLCGGDTGPGLTAGPSDTPGAALL